MICFLYDSFVNANVDLLQIIIGELTRDFCSQFRLTISKHLVLFFHDILPFISPPMKLLPKIGIYRKSDFLTFVGHTVEADGKSQNDAFYHHLSILTDVH